VDSAQNAHLRAYTSSAQNEALNKAAAAEDKAATMEHLGALPTKRETPEPASDADTTAAADDAAAQDGGSPSIDGQHAPEAMEDAAAEGGAWDTDAAAADDTSAASEEPATTVLLSVAEQQVPDSLQGASAAADAQQQLEDAPVRAAADQEGADQKQESLVARQAIEKDQELQIGAANDKYQAAKNDASGVSRASKVQALITQKADIKKLSVDLEGEKETIQEETDEKTKDVQKDAAQELEDQKTTYSKTVQVLATDKDSATALASQELQHATRMAAQAEKEALESSAEEKSKKMAAIALSPIEQAADGAIETGPLLLLQLGAEPMDDIDESTVGAMMTSAELKQRQDKEREEDEEKANEMIKDAKISMDRVTAGKRVEDLELAEEAAITLAEQQAKAAVAAAQAHEMKQHRDADDAYMSAEESAERKFREDKQRVDQRAAQKKIESTVEKNDQYDRATQMWESSKKAARQEQLDAFKGIETKQDTEMNARSEQYDASLQSTRARYKHESKDADNTKKRTTAIANQNANLGINKATDDAAKTQQLLVEQVTTAELAANENEAGTLP